MEPFERRNHRLENAGGSVRGWPGEGLIALSGCLAVPPCAALCSGAGGETPVPWLGSAPRGLPAAGLAGDEGQGGEAEEKEGLRSLPFPQRGMRGTAPASRQGCRAPPACPGPRGMARGRGPGERRHGALAVMVQRQSCVQHAPAHRRSLTWGGAGLPSPQFKLEKGIFSEAIRIKPCCSCLPGLLRGLHGSPGEPVCAK